MTEHKSPEQEAPGLRWVPTMRLRIEERTVSALTIQVLQQLWELRGGEGDTNTEWRDIRIEHRRRVET